MLLFRSLRPPPPSKVHVYLQFLVIMLAQVLEFFGTVVILWCVCTVCSGMSAGGKGTSPLNFLEVS